MKEKNAFRIELLKPEWIEEVARVHIQSLPEDFLPALGFNFLARVFYPAALASPHGRTYVALEGEQPVGFVVVALNSARFFRSIVWRRLGGFFLTGLKTVFSSRLQKSLEILQSVFSPGVCEDYGEIYEIAVRAERQGRGIGRALVAQSSDYLKEAGLPGIKIKTRRDNTQWIDFFQRSGWQLAQELRLTGRDYVVYSLEF